MVRVGDEVRRHGLAEQRRARARREAHDRLEHDVVARSAVEDVLSEAADQDVVTVAAEQGVIAVAANEDVVAVTAIFGEQDAASAGRTP